EPEKKQVTSITMPKYVKINESQNKCKIVDDYPDIFKDYDDNFRYEDDKDLRYPIKHDLQTQLLMLYAMAEHASYHYWAYHKWDDLDWTHLRFNQWDKKYNLSSMITTAPNQKVEDWVSPKPINCNLDVKTKFKYSYDDEVLCQSNDDTSCSE